MSLSGSILLRRSRRSGHQAASHVPQLLGELSLELASSIKYDALRRAERRDPNLQQPSEYSWWVP
eukprot:7754546-Pyramimonas_sp.AAC.1